TAPSPTHLDSVAEGQPVVNLPISTVDDNSDAVLEEHWPSLVLPSAIVHAVLPREPSPQQGSLQWPTPPVSPSSDGSEDVSTPEGSDNTGQDQPAPSNAGDQPSTLMTIQLLPGDEMSGYRVEAMDTLSRALARIKRDDGLYRLWPEEQLDQTQRRGGR